MALSELSERCYRTIGHYLSTIGVHYRTIGPGLRGGQGARNLVEKSNLREDPIPPLPVALISLPERKKVNI